MHNHEFAVKWQSTRDALALHTNVCAPAGAQFDCIALPKVHLPWLSFVDWYACQLHHGGWPTSLHDGVHNSKLQWAVASPLLRSSACAVIDSSQGHTVHSFSTSMITSRPECTAAACIHMYCRCCCLALR